MLSNEFSMLCEPYNRLSMAFSSQSETDWTFYLCSVYCCDHFDHLWGHTSSDDSHISQRMSGSLEPVLLL